MSADFSVEFAKLHEAPRLLLEASLKPAQGERFQPTGFADLGAAQYTTPTNKKMLLVESAQSVANRLERAVIDGDGVDLIAELAGLPYVRVEFAGDGAGITTSSLVEAHRLNSPFIIGNPDFAERLLKRVDAKGGVIDWSKAAKAVFYFDPSALLHGAFFSKKEFLQGRLRFPRAITGFIEASEVAEAASGGVKNNHFDPSGNLRAEGYDKDVYSNVPYSRLEFTAKDIRAYFNLDLALLRGYRLPEVAQRLLVALALYKVRRFLDQGLRLRTACDLVVADDLRVTAPDTFALPSKAQLAQVLIELIAMARSEEGLLAPEVVRLVTKTKRTKETTKQAEVDDEAATVEDGDGG
jgi:CRISPR-associated protein Csb1